MVIVISTMDPIEIIMNEGVIPKINLVRIPVLTGDDIVMTGMTITGTGDLLMVTII